MDLYAIPIAAAMDISSALMYKRPHSPQPTALIVVSAPSINRAKSTMRSLQHLNVSALLAASLLLGTLTGFSAEKKKKGTTKSPKDEWIQLFDGKLHDNLRSYFGEEFPDKAWVIEGDTLKTIPKKDGGVPADLMTRDKFKAFELVWEWKAATGGNSGVIYRVNAHPKEPSWFTGPEYQLLDDDVHPDGKKDRRRAACLYDLVEAEGKTLKPVGEFNSSRIVFNPDNRVEHWLNGTKVVEYVWGSDEIAELVAKSKFSNRAGFMKEKSGHITFQHHGEEFWVRNMKIRRL